jgi:two-component system C4-dicarboxylate transport sensor histidine kinase DctB
MLSRSIHRGRAVLFYLGAVAALTYGVWVYGYAQALGQLAARAEADLALASDRLVAGLFRYRSTAVLMSDHPELARLHTRGHSKAADDLLLETVDRTGALTAFYVDTSGQVLASAHANIPEQVAQSGYFLRARDGALGSGHGFSASFGKRVYFYAAPTFSPTGQVHGVLVVVVDIDTLEQDWRALRPAVFFSDLDGQVFVTSRSELLFWRREGSAMIAPNGARYAIDRRNRRGLMIWHQNFSPYVPQQARYLAQPLPVIGMVGEELVDITPAKRLAGLQAAVVAALCLVLGTLLYFAGERRRALALDNERLESRVKSRTRDLEEANSALRHEVTEREEAEAALRRAQEELVQAGKLSALGQMSAGISHELNQPLMAIRQFAENGTAFLKLGKADKAGANLAQISDLSERAARIMKNLRSFARNEKEPTGRVDLVRVIQQAVDLTETRLRDDGIRLDWNAPDAPVFVRGGEVRLSQVFVNLITNAADAMQGVPSPRLRIDVSDQGKVRVADCGPGIENPDKVFAPFYTTKTVGEGMGLGLSISYGLVQSFGGNIRGMNGENGGAVFEVSLEIWDEFGSADQQG